VFFVHVSECYFAEEENASVVFLGGEAVVRGFRGHVCEVDALAEHVACHWGFRRRDAQALAQNSHEVGEPAAVPQQHLVVDVLRVADLLGLALQREQVDEL